MLYSKKQRLGIYTTVAWLKAYYSGLGINSVVNRRLNFSLQKGVVVLYSAPSFVHYNIPAS